MHVPRQGFSETQAGTEWLSYGWKDNGRMTKYYRQVPAWILGVLLPCVFGTSAFLFAQQQPSGQQEPQSPAQTSTETPAESKSNSKTQQPPAAKNPSKPRNDRLFGVLPNYLTVEGASSLPPLTTKEKFKLQALGVFDPVEFAYIGVAAGINQASNSEPQYGQGFSGYAKRYGTSFADTMIGNFMTGAIFPSLLHQDPRYYQMGIGSFARRTEHALGRIFVTRSDGGKTEFNFSELAGNGVAAGIATAYHPGQQSLSNTVSIWWTQIGWDAAAYEMKEFWPDIHRMISRKKPPQ